MSPSLLQVTTLALWIGAAGFFSVAVAPALFAVLPTRTLAGAAVGRMLPAVLYSGMAAGLVLVGLQIAIDRRITWHGREIAGGVMIGACAIAQFIVAPRIERIRAVIGGPIDDLAVDDARRIAFGRLHGVSVAWLGVAMLAALVGLVLAARAVNDDIASR